MIRKLLSEHTGTFLLTFEDAEFSKNQWHEDMVIETLSCHYKSKENELFSLHFSTMDFTNIEVIPSANIFTEQMRIELSKVVNQIIVILKHHPLLSWKLDYNNLEFQYSDLLIHHFPSYKNRQSLSFLFQHKKLFINTYRDLTEKNDNTHAYSNKRFLTLFGKDGVNLAHFLEELNIAKPIYKQNDLLTVISFEYETLHYQYHIQYFKQMFCDLGFTCHFLDNNISQSVINKSHFLNKGGKHELSNDFSF